MPGLRRLQEFSLSARAWVEMNFENDFVKAVMLNWALAPQILPDQEGAGQSFYIMIPAIHVYGQAIPQGGSQELPNAMARYVEAHGGQVLTGCAVTEILVEDNQRAWRASRRWPRDQRDAGRWSRRSSRRQTFLELVGARQARARLRRTWSGSSRSARSASAGCSSRFSEPPQFLNGADMSACLFHRIVDSTEQMTRFYAELAHGRAAERPVPMVRLLDAARPEPRAARQCTR